MTRTSLIFVCFTLISPAVLADRPHAVPDRASSIEQFSGAVNARQADPSSVQSRQSVTNERSKQPKVPLPASSARATAPDKSIEKRKAPKIKARAVIANPNS